MIFLLYKHNFLLQSFRDKNIQPQNSIIKNIFADECNNYFMTIILPTNRKNNSHGSKNKHKQNGELARYNVKQLLKAILFYFCYYFYKINII